MANSKQPLMFLNSVRRARIAEIMQYNNTDGASITQKAQFVARQLGEPCSFAEAMSLLAQFGKKDTTWREASEINHERFERMAASRTDLY